MSLDCLLKGYSKDRKYYVSVVQKMYESYHNASVNLLQDEIHYHQDAEFLKRFYQQQEFQYKINLFGDYYQYHRQLPRIFPTSISSIIQNFQEDWRTLQYKFVCKRMKQDQTGDLAFSVRQKNYKPVQKVLKNIELSYYNFQNKSVKKRKDTEHQTKPRSKVQSKNKKSLPLLPLYAYEKASNEHQKLHTQHTNKVLGNKENLLNSVKPKHKWLSKKTSENNSSEEPNNLSRNKSKSNLVTAFGLQKANRASVKLPHNGCSIPKEKTKSSQGQLQKAQSTKNILERKKSQVRCKVIKVEQKKEQGLKSMFKRAVQVKKAMKIER